MITFRCILCTSVDADTNPCSNRWGANPGRQLDPNPPWTSRASQPALYPVWFWSQLPLATGQGEFISLTLRQVAASPLGLLRSAAAKSLAQVRAAWIGTDWAWTGFRIYWLIQHSSPPLPMVPPFPYPIPPSPHPPNTPALAASSSH